MNGGEFGLAVILCGGALLGAAWDVRSDRIPNALVLPLFWVGLSLHACAEGIPGVLRWGIAIAGLLTVGGVLFALGGMGAGDVKLLAALGGVGGVRFTPWMVLYTALVGGGGALVGLVLRSSRGERKWTASLSYGPAIGLGTIWAWWELFRSGSPPGF